MPFYSQIVEAYDQLFPLNMKQVEFVENAVGGNLAAKRIMDIGCGTGSLSIALARRSAVVRGFDYDREMVIKAEEKRPQALDLQFQEGDMKATAALYSNSMFDAVLCFGNTLVHLTSLDEVKAVFSNISKQILQGGKFLFQIINYDRILAENVDALPTIQTDKYNFVRNYIHRSDGNIDFETILSTGDEKIENTVPLLAVTKSQIVELLEPIFGDIKCYGGFDGSDWSKDTFHLVVEATK